MTVCLLSSVLIDQSARKCPPYTEQQHNKDCLCEDMVSSLEVWMAECMSRDN